MEEILSLIEGLREAHRHPGSPLLRLQVDPDGQTDRVGLDFPLLQVHLDLSAHEEGVQIRISESGETLCIVHLNHHQLPDLLDQIYLTIVAHHQDPLRKKPLLESLALFLPLCSLPS